jgi:hypothetical protein
MRKSLLLFAVAAGLYMIAPPAVQPASAQDATVRIGIGERHHDGWRHRGYRSRAAVVVGERSRCRTVTVRTHRPNGTIVIRKHRRCS